MAGPGDRGNVVCESQLVINNDPEVSCCFGWNKRQGVNIDADVVVDGLFGWKDHQFRFGQVQFTHACMCVSVCVRAPHTHMQTQIGFILLTSPATPVKALAGHETSKTSQML